MIEIFLQELPSVWSPRSVSAPAYRASQWIFQATKSGQSFRLHMAKTRYNFLAKRLGADFANSLSEKLQIHDDPASFKRITSSSSLTVLIHADFVHYAANAKGRILLDDPWDKFLELKTREDNTGKDRRSGEYRKLHDFALEHLDYRVVGGSLGHNGDRVLKFMPSPGEWKPAGVEKKIFMIGGKIQESYRLGSFFELSTDMAKSMAHQLFIVMGQIQTGTYALNRQLQNLTDLPNVKLVGPISLDSYRYLLANSFGFLDFSEMSAERERSTSTRCLQAISAGVPVLHNKGTQLEDYFSETPGRLLDIGETQAQSLVEFCNDAKSGIFDSSIIRARREGIEMQESFDMSEFST